MTDWVYDWRKNKVPPKQVANANPLQFMLLDAAAQAFEQAGYKTRPFDRSKVGVIVGTVFGGDFANQLQMGLRLPEFEQIITPLLIERGVTKTELKAALEQYRQILLKRMPALMDETGSFTSSTLASRITKTFDLQGGALALDAGAGSGLAAVSAGMDMLRSGSCDMMICAGAQRSMDAVMYEGLARGGLLAPVNQPRPSTPESMAWRRPKASAWCCSSD